MAGDNNDWIVAMVLAYLVSIALAGFTCGCTAGFAVGRRCGR